MVAYNYMFSLVDSAGVKKAESICTSAATFSDGSRVPNSIKWQMAREFIGDGLPAFSLFSFVSYEDIYAQDDGTKCIAASYIADLRAQFLEDTLEKSPNDMVAHALYIRNKQWQAKLRERANLGNLQNAFKTMRLT